MPKPKVKLDMNTYQPVTLDMSTFQGEGAASNAPSSADEMMRRIKQETYQAQAGVAQSSNPELSSALDILARINTGRSQATPELEAEAQRGRAAGHLSAAGTVAVGAAAPFAPEIFGAAKAAAPYIPKAAKLLRDAGIGGAGLHYLLKEIFGEKK